MFNYVLDTKVRSSLDYPIVVSGYSRTSPIRIQIVKCTNALTWTMEHNTVASELIKENEWFVPTQRGTIDDWRSFIPSAQSIVRFQHVPQCNSRSRAQPSILHNLLSCALYRFVNDVNQDMLFIVGTPRIEYSRIKHICRLC